VDILEYMKKVGIDSHRKVATIISAYYKDPEKVMREVRAKLAETTPIAMTQA
jgi:hypothetical protein